MVYVIKDVLSDLIVFFLGLLRIPAFIVCIIFAYRSAKWYYYANSGDIYNFLVFMSLEKNIFIAIVVFISAFVIFFSIFETIIYLIETVIDYIIYNFLLY